MRSTLPLFAALLVTTAVSTVIAQSNVPEEGDDTQLWSCFESSARQQWIIENSPGTFFNHITLANTANSSIGSNIYLVLDIAGWSNSSGAEIHVWYNTTGAQGYVNYIRFLNTFCYFPYFSPSKNWWIIVTVIIGLIM